MKLFIQEVVGVSIENTNSIPEVLNKYLSMKLFIQEVVGVSIENVESIPENLNVWVLDRVRMGEDSKYFFTPL